MNFSNIKDWTIPQGSVTRVTDSHGIVIWEKGKHDYSQDYFFIEDISGQPNTVSIKKSTSSAPTIEVFYSTDQTNWSSMGSTSTTAITATIPANGRLYLKATVNAWGTSLAYYDYINANRAHNVCGNTMSLLYGDNFTSQTTLPANYTLTSLFLSNRNMVSAENLVLPAIYTRNYCYDSMFYGCSSLTTPPELPATRMYPYCYKGMFYNCSSLTAAPALPTTNLNYASANNCYQSMFYGCSSLTTPPELPATGLTSNCYESMFENCIHLATAPVLPATRMHNSCYAAMFKGCKALITPPVLPSTTLAEYCYQSMFQGCTALTQAPALPATTLERYCYNMMFDGCSKITATPVLPATTLTAYCYESMFGSCTKLNKVTTYAQDISAGDCLYNWLAYVSATGDFYNLGGATYPSGVSGIPTGWTEHTSL